MTNIAKFYNSIEIRIFLLSIVDIILVSKIPKLRYKKKFKTLMAFLKMVSTNH